MSYRTNEEKLLETIRGTLEMLTAAYSENEEDGAVRDLLDSAGQSVEGALTIIKARNETEV